MLASFPVRRPVVGPFVASPPTSLSQFVHFATQLIDLLLQFADSLVQFRRFWMAFAMVRFSPFSVAWTFRTRPVFRTTRFSTSSVFPDRIPVISLVNLPDSLMHQVGQVAHASFSQHPGRLHDLFDPDRHVFITVGTGLMASPARSGQLLTRSFVVLASQFPFKENLDLADLQLRLPNLVRDLFLFFTSFGWLQFSLSSVQLTKTTSQFPEPLAQFSPLLILLSLVPVLLVPVPLGFMFRSARVTLRWCIGLS